MLVKNPVRHRSVLTFLMAAMLTLPLVAQEGARDADLDARMRSFLAVDEELDRRVRAFLAEDASNLVQLAILLDTSGSMKGLVDQARCQFWNVVDELARASRDGQRARLEVAVYEYGNQRLPKSAGFVRQVLPFTDDLDRISRALFSLTLEGGEEYCGVAIRRALDELAWSTDPDAYRAVFIAGNEPFDQGPIGPAALRAPLESRGVTLNTVWCEWNKAKPGEANLWKTSALFGDGAYAAIDHNHHLPNRPTPFDAEFMALNDRMNETYLWYGKRGEQARRNMLEQDRNARKMSPAVFAARMSSKVGHLYHHVHADMVDAVTRRGMKMNRIGAEQMPERMRQMTTSQRMRLVEEMAARRETVRREMTSLVARRHAWLKAQGHADATGPMTFGDAFLAAVRDQARRRGFTFSGDMAATVGMKAR